MRLRALAEACASSRGGDRPAFEELHRRLGPGVRGFFLKRLGAARAEIADDLSQRVWTGLFEAFSQGRYDPSRAAVSTFIYAIAAKTWLRHLRQNRRGTGPAAGSGGADNLGGEGWEQEVFSTDDGPESDVTAADELEAMRRCLRDRGGPGSLTDDEQAIVLAAAAGASDRALADRLGLAPSTVNAKKQSAWEKLRRAMARLGYRAEEAESAERRGGTGE